MRKVKHFTFMQRFQRITHFLTIHLIRFLSSSHITKLKLLDLRSFQKNFWWKKEEDVDMIVPNRLGSVKSWNAGIDHSFAWEVIRNAWSMTVMEHAWICQEMLIRLSKNQKMKTMKFFHQTFSGICWDSLLLKWRYIRMDGWYLSHWVLFTLGIAILKMRPMCFVGMEDGRVLRLLLNCWKHLLDETSIFLQLIKI